ncbi:hypothetical protein K1719_019495 [Acacia pycnantha]|nr:hypothetical protein K1719_019495 [Acacia pycnantha]
MHLDDLDNLLLHALSCFADRPILIMLLNHYIVYGPYPVLYGMSYCILPCDMTFWIGFEAVDPVGGGAMRTEIIRGTWKLKYGMILPMSYNRIFTKCALSITNFVFFELLLEM